MEFYKYEKNYLTDVICRVDFSPILEISEKLPSEFQKLIKDKFPVLNKSIVIKVITQFKGLEKLEKEERYPEYNFSNNEKTWSLKFSQDFISINFKKYINFREFKKIVNEYFEKFFQIYNPGGYERLGLRYINQIKVDKGNPFKWESYINNYLNSAVTKFIDKIDNQKNISRYMNHIILNHDDYILNFKYGIFNSLFPDKISQKEYILDYDCYTTDFEGKKIYELIKTFNEKIYYYFEKSIKDDLRKIMGVIKND